MKHSDARYPDEIEDDREAPPAWALPPVAGSFLSPCPDQADCYGEIIDRTPRPFWMIDVKVGNEVAVGDDRGKIIGFADEYTAIVKCGLTEVRLPVESFY